MCIRDRHITAKCSGNIIKNVRCVIIPNSGGLTGIEAGVVLGAVAGDPSLNMEVLSKVNESGRKRCCELLDKKICKVELLDSPVVLHFIIEMQAGDDTVSLEIKYDHINVTKIVKNQEVLLDSDHKSGETPAAADRTLLLSLIHIFPAHWMNLQAITDIITVINWKIWKNR